MRSRSSSSIPPRSPIRGTALSRDGTSGYSTVSSRRLRSQTFSLGSDFAEDADTERAANVNHVTAGTVRQSLELDADIVPALTVEPMFEIEAGQKRPLTDLIRQRDDNETVWRLITREQRQGRYRNSLRAVGDCEEGSRRAHAAGRERRKPAQRHVHVVVIPRRPHIEIVLHDAVRIHDRPGSEAHDGRPECP